MTLLRRLSADQKRSLGHWAMELIVVIAGVLIALWLQELVERRRAVADLHAAEDAIHDEVRSALTSLIWREAISQCHLDRAKLLKSALTDARDDWPGLDDNALVVLKPGLGRYSAPTVFPSVYQRPRDTFSTSAWNSALTTSALAPMDHQRFGQLVAIYDIIQVVRENQELEDHAATKLSALAFPMRLTPQIRVELIQALYDIDRSRFSFSAFGAAPLAQEMKTLGWDDKAAVDRWIVEDAADDRRNHIVWKPCVRQPKNPFG